jgi:hypothetical protein
MAFKGQVELIVIVALMVVIAVVVVSQMNLFIMPGETPDVRGVRESVEGLIRTAVLDTIETMSDRGGYLSTSDYQLGSVILNGKQVPFWQFGGQVTYPDKSSNFQEGVRAYLEDNKDSLSEVLSNVTIGDPLVSPPVFSDSQITVTVTMPTTYRGSPLQQPFVVNVDTGFSRAYEFSKGLAVYEANSRPFEYFTLSSMLLSPMENGHHSIPMYEVLIGCGDYLFATSWDTSPKVEKTIVKTLAHTYMPGKVPLNTIRTSSSPKYSLVKINGKEYQDLQVSFMLPDDFSLGPSNFRMSPDPASGVAEPIPMVAQCMSPDPIAVQYSFEYPVIVRAFDEEGGQVFQFAVLASITDNLPTDWSVTTDPEEDIQAQVCATESCLLELDVVDGSGNPVGGAAVNFMGCYQGTTDSSGYLSTLAPCGAGSLYIYKSGYAELIESRSSANLIGEVTLFRMPQITLNLYEVEVSEYQPGSYMIYYGNYIRPIEGLKAYITFRSAENFQEYTFYSSDPSLTVSTLPPGDYYVVASLSSPDLQKLEGSLTYPFTITEDTSLLNLYIPAYSGLDAIFDPTQQNLKIAELNEVLESCGIGPVTEIPYVQEEACSVTLT